MQHLIRLKTIHLDFNHIVQIEPDLFKDCVTMIEIYCNTIGHLSMNQIQENLIESNRSTFLDIVTFICSFQSAECLLNSVEACHNIDYLSYFSNRYKLDLFKLISESEQNILTKIIVESIVYLFQDSNNIIQKFKPYFNESDKLAFKVLECLTTIVKNWLFSASFCKNFVNYSGIKIDK